MKTKKSLALKLSVGFTAIVALTCVILVGTSLAIFTTVGMAVTEIRYNDILNENVKSEVQTGLSIVQHYYDEAESGKLSTADAQSLAKEAIRAIRYNDDQGGYIWIDDTDANLVMHPILPEQEGTNRIDLQDCNGVYIIKGILEAANNGGGFNRFVFTKSDGVTEAEKLAYSEKFEPWNWVLTSGCYLDDLEANMDNTQIETIFNKSMYALLGESIVLIIIMSISTLLIVRKLMKSLNVINTGLEQLSRGDLTFQFHSRLLKRKDEIGNMMQHTNQAFSNLREIVEEGLSTSKEVSDSGNHMSEATHSAMETSDQISRAMEGVAGDASEQANAIASVMNNVTSMQTGADEIRTSTEEISDCTKALVDSSHSMRQNLEEMQKGSTDMNTQVNAISEKITETNKTIERMSDILNSIEEIASQTKLLSLNASIEAARAGESGRGFAVVADSINSLSENTSNELANIQEIIASLVANFQECNASIEKVVASNQVSMEDSNEVIESFRILDEQIETTENKVDTIHSIITRTISQIDAVSQQMTGIEHSAENSAAASQEVTASVQELRSLMQTMDTHASELNEKAERLDHKLNEFHV